MLLSILTSIIPSKDRPDSKADALGIKYTPGFIAPVMGDTYLKQHDAPEDIEYYLCGPPMMSKTVLNLLHSLGVEDDLMMLDDIGSAANNAFGYQGKRYAIGCLDSCKRILVVCARVHICMVCLESISWLRRHHPIYVP